jgi:predicted acylesterase/phospholipase RssA
VLSSIKALDVADPERPFGLVLSGGGARGAFQVGVWEVLRRDRAGLDGDPAVVSGTSAGSINGALIAAGFTPEAMMDFWLGLAETPPVTANEELFRSLRAALTRLVAHEPARFLRRRGRGARIALGLVRHHALYRPSGWLSLALELLMTARYDNLSDVLDNLSTSYVFSTGRFRERLVKAFGGEYVRAPRIALAINTVDVRTGRVVRFVNRPPGKRAAADDSHYRHHPAITVDMVLASASIPLLFNPVTVDGLELWDGGLLVNTPLAPAIALGARRLIPVLVNAGNDASRHQPMHFGTGVERLADAFLENAYNTDRKLLLIRNELARLAGHVDPGLTHVDLYEPIRPMSSRTFNAGSYLYFERDALIRMYEAGRHAARQWLVRGPRLDSARAGHPGDAPRAGD